MSVAVDPTSIVVQTNDGEYDPDYHTTEANLNTQYAHAIAYSAPQGFYSAGAGRAFIPGSNEPDEGNIWLEWLTYMLSLSNAPQTVCTAYGICENIFPREGTRGVSLIFASGNHGVGEGNCMADNCGSKM